MGKKKIDFYAQKINNAVEKVAKEVLMIENLNAQSVDSKDFHLLHVNLIRKALEAAYHQGKEDESFEQFLINEC